MAKSDSDAKCKCHAACAKFLTAKAAFAGLCSRHFQVWKTLNLVSLGFRLSSLGLKALGLCEISTTQCVMSAGWPSG